MTKKSKPRAGSLAFYPRKRAKRETPSFSSFPEIKIEGAKPLNFLGYKAGMLHVVAMNQHESAVSYGQEVVVPATAIECPPLKIFGVRAYEKTPHGLRTATELTVGKVDKNLLRKIKSFKKKHKKKAKGEKDKKKDIGGEEKITLEDLEKKKDGLAEIRLLAHTTPIATGIGKKKPEIIELKLSGSIDEQFAYAKEKFGKEIAVNEIFKDKQFVDVKAVDKGKGFSGVVKRFGVKIHRPKAKKRRVVGSIGPWNPSTVMWTVARAGQLGYQARTEYNKRILMIGSNPAVINPSSGFKNYGVIKNDFVLLAGSMPGPSKRAVALREPIRKSAAEKHKISELLFISTVPKKIKEVAAEEEETKAKKVVAKKEEVKKEEKSVEEEIAAAVEGKKEKKGKKK